MSKASVLEKVKKLPLLPGVYLMRDANGTVIYVGKALRLKERVRSYFQKYHQQNDHKVFMLSQLIDDLETIVTRSEVEALVLEEQLIKSYRPRFNVLLKDDKRFPYLKITIKEKYPRLMITRRVLRDGARYFGPYTNAQLMRETMNTLRRFFPIRTCNDKINSKQTRQRPCLDFFIKECTAPCVLRISPEAYGKTAQQLGEFLSGKHRSVIAPLETEMLEAAEALQFERAAKLRDMMESLQRLIGQHKAYNASNLVSRDVIGMASENGTCAIQVFFVRDGDIKGREHIFMDVPEGSTPGEVLHAFLTQFYTEASIIPKEILLPEALEQSEWIENWLTKRLGQKVQFLVPQRGSKHKLIDLAMRNAELALFEKQNQMQKRTRREQALVELQQELLLPRLPERIECYDISNIQGTDAVGAMTVFEGGVPKKTDYRRFKIKTIEGANDYAMMAEMLERRLKRGLIEQDSLKSQTGSTPPNIKFAKFPDLIVIDGGKGQLSTTVKVLKKLNLEDLPIVGLAKRREEIFQPGQSKAIWLPRDSEALYLLQHIRDEAHRFGVTYHRSLRQRRTVQSALDDIPGVGDKRRAALIQHFGSVTQIKMATIEEIHAVKGVSKLVAEHIYAALHVEELKDTKS